MRRRLRPGLLVLLVATAGGVALEHWRRSLPWPAPDPESWSYEDLSERDRRSPEVQERIEAIEAELASGEALPAWAGEYFFGNGLGRNVTLWVAPEAGCAALWTGCMGPYGEAQGTLSLEGSHLRLHLEGDNNPGAFGDFWTEYVPVAWGERAYLVPPEQGLAFADEVRLGLEPREFMHGIVPLRRGDEELEVSGPCAALEELAPVERRGPMTAEVVECLVVRVPGGGGSSDFGRCLVRLDRGLEGGYYRGMEVELDLPEVRGILSGDVEFAGATSCFVELVLSRGDPIPLPGWRFTREVPSRR